MRASLISTACSMLCQRTTYHQEEAFYQVSVLICHTMTHLLKATTPRTATTASLNLSELLHPTTTSTPTPTPSKTGTEQAQQQEPPLAQSTNKPLTLPSTRSPPFPAASPRPQPPPPPESPPATSSTKTTTKKRRCSASSSRRCCLRHRPRSALEEEEVLLEPPEVPWETDQQRVATVECLEEVLEVLEEEDREVSRE